MYFWKIHKLKSDLLESPLSESASFKYLFADIIVYSLAMIPFLENNRWDVYSAIIAALITAIGVYYVYKCNKGASGNNFLEKYLSIGWVVGIRWTVLVLLPIMIVYFIIMEIYAGIPDYTTPIEAIFFNLLYISYFWLLGKHVKEIAHSDPSTSV